MGHMENTTYLLSSKHPQAHPAECQADRLVDFVLEQILRDSVHHLETMPSKVEAHRGHREGWRFQWDFMVIYWDSMVI